MGSESGLHADAAFFESMQVSDLFCAPMGRLAGPVYALGALGAGLAIWAGVLMLGTASLAEVIAPLAGAWAAWTAVIALKLWIWSGLGNAVAAAVASEAAPEPFAAESFSAVLQAA